MSREFMLLGGVSPETRKALRDAALARFGTANASLMVRSLIARFLEHTEPGLPPRPITEAEAADTVRMELRLPRTALAKLTGLAEQRLTPRNHYAAGVILERLGQPQLCGDQIEALRQSNYELAKIGTNINQIARAFNILVNGGGGKMPEVGKKLVSLRREIKEHTDKVLRALSAGTAMLEVKRGRGQRASKQPKRRRTS
jgi:hypothetical protein